MKLPTMCNECGVKLGILKYTYPLSNPKAWASSLKTQPPLLCEECSEAESTRGSHGSASL